MPRVLASTRLPPRHGAPARPATTTARPRARAGERSTGPAHLRTRAPSAAPRSTTSTCPRTPRRSTGRRWCSCTASAASGRTGSRTSPALALERRVVALDLPGFGLSPMPARARSRSRSTRAWWRRWASTSGSGRVALVGNSMGGFIGAELAIRFPPRVERLVLVSAAGITTTNLYRSARASRSAAPPPRSWPTPRPATARRRAPAVGRPLALSLVARHPSRLDAGPRVGGDDQGRGQAGIQRRPARLPGVRLPRAAARDRLPDADRVGRERRRAPRGRTRTNSSA